MVTAQLVRYLYVDDGGCVEQEVKAVQVRRTTEPVQFGNRENAGLFAGWGEDALRALGCR